MKFNWEQKNTVNVITGVLIFAISILCYFIFSNMKSIVSYTSNLKYVLMPFILGGAIAYILNFFVKFFENSFLKFEFFRKLKVKHVRMFAMIITYFIFFAFIVLLLKYIIPQFYSNIKLFVDRTPAFIDLGVEKAKYMLQNVEISSEIRTFINGKLTEFATFSTTFLTDMIPLVATFATRVISLFLNIILAIIISVYLLYDKENFSRILKKFMIAVFPDNANRVTFKIVKRFDYTLRSYLLAKGIGAIIVGITFYIILLFMKIDYALLFAFILGFTNLIPWFGCYLGAVPIVIVLLFTSTLNTVLWFMVIVVIVSMIDANVISPRVSGKSLGISSFWVIFALVLGGSLFGVIGFLLSVPIFVVIYTTLKEYIEDRLTKKGYSLRNPAEEFEKKEV
ncbi:AI-2E family transporter [Parvimonas sp. C2]|uniref:AI-2E family transporter n=1 Tax=Parvimonas sp. C2 TaxID=3110692 RepID=UPI002B480260|nr:AI-2E family transporter [Parvimonas sp. C2]MEB3073309.1 AI-2E family transporter [Parvimonas sp. C2]